MSTEAEPIAAALRQSWREPRAYAAFYREYADPLLRHFMRRVYNVETALDLAAETLTEAYLGRRRFRGSTDAEARAWLYGIASRRLSGYYRSRAVDNRARRRLGLERPSPADEVETRLIEREALEEMNEAVTAGLASLSAEQRSAIELRFEKELPYAEIAARLKISEPAARARVSRGLRALGEVLTRQASPTEPPTLLEVST